MGYTYKSRTYIPEDVLEKMPQLNKGVYFAVQRVLHTIWFGGNSPVDEAITWTVVEKGEQPDRQYVEEKLIEFVNLVLRKIPSLQNIDIVEQHTSYRVRSINQWITQGLLRIEERKKELAPIDNEVWRLEAHVSALRKRHAYLSSQEKALQRKILEMEAHEQEVQKGLERIGKLSPVEVKKCLAIAQSLAEQVEKDI